MIQSEVAGILNFTYRTWMIELKSKEDDYEGFQGLSYKQCHVSSIRKVSK